MGSWFAWFGDEKKEKTDKGCVTVEGCVTWSSGKRALDLNNNQGERKSVKDREENFKSDQNRRKERMEKKPAQESRLRQFRTFQIA